MFKIVFTASLILLSSAKALAAETIRIESGTSYEKYTHEELKRRVWNLEKAVAQLQDQVFQLALRGREGGGTVSAGGTWSCRIESFGKTFVASGISKASAVALVLKKCSDASNAIHCDEKDVKCGND